MASTPEKKVKMKVTKVLKELGIWHFYPQSGIYGRSGIPDIIGILPGGRALALEVKAGTNYGVTALQERVMNEMLSAGAFVSVIVGDEDVPKLRDTLHAVIKLKV